jgi:hypothetical protein
MWMDKMTEKNKQDSTRVGENIELEVPDGEEIEEVTDEQLERVKQGLLKAIASTDLNEHQITIGRDHYALLQKMEDYAQDLAALVVRYFKEKDLEAIKLNPPAGPGHDVNLVR